MQFLQTTKLQKFINSAWNSETACVKNQYHQKKNHCFTGGQKITKSKNKKLKNEKKKKKVHEAEITKVRDVWDNAAPMSVGRP